MSDELKPCPFCGGDAGFDHNHHEAAGHVYWAYCRVCDAWSGYFPCMEVAGSVWNRRAIDARIADLERQLAEGLAREERLRKALVAAGMNCLDDFVAAGCLQLADSPFDATALRQAIEAAKAEERGKAVALCNAEADRMEQEAQQAIENGEHDEVSSIRSAAWKLSVVANRIKGQP